MSSDIVLKFTLPENSKVKIILKSGDITEENVDVIVNAANSYLAHGGGVAGAIVRKGGYSIQQESNAIINKIGYLPVGECAITNAGKLPAKKIIHTVGPRWGEGDEYNKLLNSTYNALKMADEKHLSTISFPAVSSGIFGFPKDKCARVMLNGVKKYLAENKDTQLKEIRFCIIDDYTLRIFEKEFEKLI